VGKYWIDKLKTNVSGTYSVASGRHFYDRGYGAPGTAADVANFFADKTSPYYSLSLTAAYLRSFGKWFTVFYVSVENVTKERNVFGYRYDAAGNKTEIVPALFRTVFFGVNMSLSEFSKDEL
jgi:hypothetical protein